MPVPLSPALVRNSQAGRSAARTPQPDPGTGLWWGRETCGTQRSHWAGATGSGTPISAQFARWK